MAATAGSVGSPVSAVNTQAASTVAARKMRPGQRLPGPGSAPGRFNPDKFQNPNAARAYKLSRNRDRFQGGGGGGAGGGPRAQTMGAVGQQDQGWGQGGTPSWMGGGQAGGYPGDSPWWAQRPQQPPQRMWGSPQFNYMGGNAPSAQPYGGPNWGGMRGGYGQASQYGGGGGYGMPQGGMPGYQGQQ